MLLALQLLAGWMAFVALFGFALMGWAIYSGQLDDVESISRIPLNEREPEGWPGRSPAEKGV